MVIVVIGVAMAMFFAVHNLRLEIDPLQKLWNIGLWFLGTSLGTSLAIFLGLLRTGKD